jgi:L-alanine-DL-glutamate epimerase-like enolase superfamily enzyme
MSGAHCPRRRGLPVSEENEPNFSGSHAWYFEADGSTDNPFRTSARSPSYTLSPDGTVLPLEGPGLGIDVDEDYLRAHPLTEGPAWR